MKKAEHRRIDAFELWCWRRLLRVPWTARRSNQSILKEITPGISLEGMMLKLKLQYFGHLMWRVDSLEKTHAGRDWGLEEQGTTEDEMARWVWVNSGSWWWTGRPGVLQVMGSHRVGHDWATELNWTLQLCHERSVENYRVQSNFRAYNMIHDSSTNCDGSSAVVIVVCCYFHYYWNGFLKKWKANFFRWVITNNYSVLVKWLV